MKKKIERLSSTLDRLLARRGMGSRLKEYRLVGRWETIVGPVIARHARPVSLRGKKLFVAVDSSAWMQQLTLLKPELLEKVNNGPGAGSVESIVLKIGEVPASASPGAGQRPAARARLDEKEEALLDAATQGLKDQELRQALRHLMEKDLLRRKKKV